MIEIFWFMIQEEMSRIMQAEKERVKGEVGGTVRGVRDDFLFIFPRHFFNNFRLEVGTKFRKILFLLFAAKR
jgi:hypothetical protein